MRKIYKSKMLIKYSGIKELEVDPFAEKARMTAFVPSVGTERII